MSSFLTNIMCVLLVMIGFQLSFAEAEQAKTYIVQLRSPHDHISHLLSHTQERERWYQSVLSEIISDDEKPSSRIVHNYHHVFTGFAAKLTPHEFEALQKMEVLVSARPETMYHLATTHSPKFMGLDQSCETWQNTSYGKGRIIAVLDSGINLDHSSFKWPEQVIAAKSFVGTTPDDDNGHGSHVAGIAAGYWVNGANVYGEGAGQSSGIAPLAKLAIYKVCLPDPADDSYVCPGSAILAGFEAAVAFGAHVISVSIGPLGQIPFYQDEAAIGAFSAMRKGIFVSVVAGNEGPSSYTISNEAPWYLTVGANTTDRDITLSGANNIRSVLERDIGRRVRNRTTYGNLNAPRVAYFSSRGPTAVARRIIKPDIIGPGVDIIAAGRTGEKTFAIMSGTSMATPHLSGAAALLGKQHPKWSPANIKSALMTTAYQTNGKGNRIIDEDTNGYAGTDVMGAGHVDVVRAADPGLVFDIEPIDYLPYICSLGYSDQQVSAIVSSPVKCNEIGRTSGTYINLPSFWIDDSAFRQTNSATVYRYVTNAGSDPDEIYVGRIEYDVQPDNLLIEVHPQKLQFSKFAVLTFRVSVTSSSSPPTAATVSAFLKYTSPKHLVTIPIMVAITG